MARIRRQQNTGNGVHQEKQKVWNIAVYIRLSREDGNEESESVINQKKILSEYLDQYFEDPYEVTDFYIDDGLTGTDDTRADFMRMIQDIEQKKVNCIVCKTLARAFRNYSDQGYYLEYYFPQKKVRFISTGDPKIDTHTNPEAITGLEVPITGLMNDRFAGKTSSDVRRTFNTKRRNGEFIGAFPPYGYLKHPDDKNRLILDEDIVPIKRDMLHWIIRDSMSLAGVAKRLNELGIPNPTAYKRSKGWNYCNPNVKENDGMWTGSTVRRILMDKVNLGHMIQGKQRVVSYKVHDKISVPEEEWFVKENTHEATFTQEEYDTLAGILARDTRTPNGSRTVHLFSGFLRCNDCHKAPQRKSAKGNVYYACRTYTEKSKDKCTKHSIREDVLENAVLAAIQSQIALLDSIDEILDEIDQMPVSDTQAQRIDRLLEERQRDLDKAKALYDDLYIDWKSGEIRQDSYRRMKLKFENQIAQLSEAISNLEKEKRCLSQGTLPESQVISDFRKHKNIQRLDRNLLIELVDTIYIHEGKEITIVFRFADELERIVRMMEENTPES